MRIGFVSIPVAGHLNPMTALARKLQSRGNDVVFIGVPDAAPYAYAAGLQFVPYCEEEYPAGTIPKEWAHVAKLRGPDVVEYTFQNLSPGLTRAALEHLPRAIADAGVEALVLDTTHFFLELVAMSAGIPYVHVWNVLNLDFSGFSPACLFGWRHEVTPEAQERNVEGLKWVNSNLSRLAEYAVSYAENAGLEIDWSDPGATASKLAIVSQMPREFDYPDIPWPAQFHYTGPFHDNDGRRQVAFPWDRVTGKPLIYASLGTLVNGFDYVHNTILETATRLPEMQFVLSVGRNTDLNDLLPAPANTILVRSAPQLELLKCSELCITHAGLNTALEALTQGVPMVAIPIGYDQPGVAARIVHHGVGESVELEDLTTERLTELVQRVRKDPGYGYRARRFQKVIAETNGLEVAARVIERAFGRSNVVDSDAYAGMGHI